MQFDPGFNIGRLCDINKPIEYKLGDIHVTTSLKGITKGAIEEMSRVYFEKEFDLENIFPKDINSSLQVINKNIKAGACVGFIFYKNLPVGAVIADKSRLDFFNETVLQLTFYHVSLSKYMAFKATIAAFRFLALYAKNKKINYIIAQCNPHDSKQSLNKILQKEGWRTASYTSILKIGEDCGNT